MTGLPASPSPPTSRSPVDSAPAPAPLDQQRSDHTLPSSDSISRWSRDQALVQPIPVSREAIPVSVPWRIPREGKLWLLAALGLWVVGWMKGINLLLLFCYLMVALWVINLIFARRVLRPLSAKRSLPDWLIAGEPIHWVVEVTWAEPKVRRTSLREGGGWALEDTGPMHALGWFVSRWEPRATSIRTREEGAAEKQAGSVLRLTQEVVLPKRGIVECDPIRVWSRFPFGLVQREIEIGAKEEILVLPRCGTVDRTRLTDWLRVMTSGDGRRHHTHRAASQEADVHSLRPFRLGDSPRWIHWRTTARRGELMVREFERPDSHDLLVILDPWLRGSKPQDEENLENAISLAATICRTWCQEPGTRLALLIARPDPSSLSGHTSGDLGQRTLELLAREAGRRDPRPGAWDQGLHRTWTGMIPLVITTRHDSPVAAELERILGHPVGVAYPDRTYAWYTPPRASSLPRGEENRR